MNNPFVVPVSGFLGAGKTSLILTAARMLGERGFKTAVILNDQGGELVDTAHVSRQGIPVGEVAGGCFCCRFSELLETAAKLRNTHLDVIFIEPVGSCTDLAATVIRPLLLQEGRYRIAPLTVVVDAERFADLADPSIKYLFDKQLEEADIVLFSKSDLPAKPLPELPGIPPRFASAKTGQGVPAWLDEVLSGELAAGSHSLNIDYRDYARAEAALGWLNWSGTINLTPALSPALLIGPWMDRLQQGLRASGATLAHLKVLDQAGGVYLKAALTSNSGDPAVEGDLAASSEKVHAVRLNLRAVLSPDKLRALFEQELDRLPGAKSVTSFQCFSPAEPRPERRIPAPISGFNSVHLSGKTPS